MTETATQATHAPMPTTLPTSFWRRWAYFANAFFYAAFTLALFTTAHITYAAPARTRSPSQIPVALSVAIVLVFLLALLVAILGNLALALGLFRRRYHLLLRLTYGFATSIIILFGGSEIAYSIRVGYGYSEPLTWLLVGVYQTIVTLSASQASPPPRMRFVAPLLEFCLRLRAGVRAFVRAYRLPLEVSDLLDAPAGQLGQFAGGVS